MMYEYIIQKNNEKNNQYNNTNDNLYFCIPKYCIRSNRVNLCRLGEGQSSTNRCRIL